MSKLQRHLGLAEGEDAALVALVSQRRRESCAVKQAFTAELDATIARAAAIMVAAIKRGGRIFTCGNGGSAADAEHLAAELVGRCTVEREALPAMALASAGPTLTALGNDYGYERVFARQVEALVQRGDVLVIFSTSGSSPNVVAAARSARERGAQVVGITGAGGGALTELAHTCIAVPSEHVPRVQEAHVFVIHMLVELIEALRQGDAGG